MYDLSFFRQNLDAIATRLADRGFTLDVEAFRQLDADRRAALTESEQLKALRKTESQEIGKLIKAGQDATDRQQKVREMGDRTTALEERAKELDDKYRKLLAGVPNTPHASVPAGRSADDNVEVRRWGTSRDRSSTKTCGRPFSPGMSTAAFW